MAESELLIEKRAALEEARRLRAIAQEREERFEQGRPYLDGVQVDTLDLVHVGSRDFPDPFNPSQEQADSLHRGIQDFLASCGAHLFLSEISVLVDKEAGHGGRSTWWVNLKRIFSRSPDTSYFHVSDAFVRYLILHHSNLAEQIVQDFKSRGPGAGHWAAADAVRHDPIWAELSALASSPEKQRRTRAQALGKNLRSRLAASEPPTQVWEDIVGAIIDYRDGPGRWQQMEDAQEQLRTLWIDIAGLDESLSRDEVIENHSHNSTTASGEFDQKFDLLGVRGPEMEVQLIEEKGGVMPPPSDLSNPVDNPTPRRERNAHVAITKDMLSSTTPLFIRTDFSNDAAWARIRDEATATVQIDGGELGGGYDAAANVLPVDNREFDGLTTDELLDLPWPDPEQENGQTYFFVVDDRTVSHPEHPILAVNLYLDKGETFRVIPEAMAMVEMNLSIANLSFSDYGQQGDGIERYSGIS